MKTLLFIGHTYHQKTKSSVFLLDLLRQDYLITEFYMDSEQPLEYEPLGELQQKEFDVLLIWQVMPKTTELKKYISWQHTVFFPMYDHFVAIGGFNAKIWKEYQEALIVSFSKTLCDDLCTCGFDARYIQYFPEPGKIGSWGAEDSLFFWQRRTNLNMSTLAQAATNLDLKKVHLHAAPDPGHSTLHPSAFDEGVASFFENIACSESVWFAKKEQMYETMEQSGLYMAPRHMEGIGMSFLEAMAHGRCVIAPDRPTMNEYITDGVNGLLYPWDDTSESHCGASLKRPAKTIREIQQNAYQTIVDGRKKWDTDKHLILEWLQQEARPDRKKLRINSIFYYWNNLPRTKWFAITFIAKNLFLFRFRDINSFHHRKK